MNVLIPILLFIGLSACTSLQAQKSASDDLTFSRFQKFCGPDSESDTICEKLHEKAITIRGKLYYPETSIVATIFPRDTIVPQHADDRLWDKVPDEEVMLRLDRENIALVSKMKTLHTKSVVIHGRVNTECITAARGAAEEMDRVNNNIDPDDDIIIMLSGFCHSHGAYVSNFEID